MPHPIESPALYNPGEFNFARDVVDYWSQQGGDPPAMIYNSDSPEGTLTLPFSHFSERSKLVASALRSAGIKKGDVVVVMSKNAPEW
jgi:acyl-coenzyme A synthetase/AMP-(fatty) acid ligase